MRQLDVAIVGSGIIGHNHAEAIVRHPGLRVAAVVDPVPAAAARLAAHVRDLTGAAPDRFGAVGDALAAGVDLVVVCTPSGLHADATVAALAAGTHVVVEKPLDASLPRAQEIARLAAEASKRGQVCSVISQHRFDPASAAVRQAIEAGRFGRLTSAVASVPWWRGQEYYDSAGWRGTWEYDGGGATMNQGIHVVDLLLWLLGRPVEVSAHTGLLAHRGIEVEDVTVATVRFDSGALAVLHATTAAYPGLPARLQVHGSLGSAVVTDDQLEYFSTADGPPGNQAASVVAPEDVWGNPKPVDSFVLGHLRQYEDLVSAIGSGGAPGVPVDEALLAMATVKAMYRSSDERRPVAIDELLHAPVVSR